MRLKLLFQKKIVYVCKTADEAYHPACVGEHGQNVRISAMF
jgi:hypothetical protein